MFLSIFEIRDQVGRKTSTWQVVEVKAEQGAMPDSVSATNPGKTVKRYYVARVSHRKPKGVEIAVVVVVYGESGVGRIKSDLFDASAAS